MKAARFVVGAESMLGSALATPRAPRSRRGGVFHFGQMRPGGVICSGDFLAVAVTYGPDTSGRMRTLPSLFVFLGICGASAVGCGGATTGNGNGSPPATVKGSVGGQPVPNTDTVGVVSTQSFPGPNGTLQTQTFAEVGVLNIPNTCAILQRHGEPASTKIFAVGVIATGTSVAAGTYTIQPSTSSTLPRAMAEYSVTDANCNNTTTENAMSGTVTLTAAMSSSSSAVQGSFDVTMTNGDHLTGTFDAPVCHYDSTSTSNPTCGS
jgi:hypothetical protein